MISNHLKFINQAHQIASKNLGKTFPNPSVGCLICKNNQIEFEKILLPIIGNIVPLEQNIDSSKFEKIFNMKMS